ncbi:hypothetical protein DFJ74DRAFT_745421 [Hyaloraphidium curvatum]|nr:hypothetical protein DFJ74DRAFT_745421 [Hyaloraphidium curvatum]
MWPSFLASLFLAFFLSLLSSTTALRILTLVDPPSPMLAGAATSLRLLLRDPMRRMQPATIDSLVPPPSLDGRAGGLVHVFAALAEPPGLAHARLVASQDAENATLFLVRTSFPVPGIYKLRARFAVLNPGTPRWDDPAAMTRTREVEMVQLGRGGEAWAVDEAADETLLEDEVEIVVGVGPIPVKEGLITDGVAVGRKDEAGWTVFGARPTPDADVRMDAKWLPRLRKPETVIDDRCNLLLVTFSRTLGKRGSETAAPIMGTDWIEPITDLISAARIGNSDVASPLHITTVSEKRIAHSNIAIPLHAVADIRTGAVPDLCTRQVMKA